MLGCILDVLLKGEFLAVEDEVEERQTDDFQKATHHCLVISLFNCEEPPQRSRSLLHNKEPLDRQDVHNDLTCSRGMRRIWKHY